MRLDAAVEGQLVDGAVERGEVEVDVIGRFALDPKGDAKSLEVSRSMIEVHPHVCHVPGRAHPGVRRKLRTIRVRKGRRYRSDGHPSSKCEDGARVRAR